VTREGPGTRDTGWRESEKGKSGGAGELGQGAAVMDNSSGGTTIWELG
jgi:hypothetical protein